MIQQSFLAAIQPHRGMLIQIASAWCAVREDRHDLIQDMLVELWRAYPRYDPTKPFSTFMYRVALNVAISASRSRSRRPVATASFHDPGFDLAAADDDLASGDDDLQALSELLRRLEPVERGLLLLYLAGHDQNEIAETLGISASNVSTRLHRLKQKLSQGAKP